MSIFKKFQPFELSISLHTDSILKQLEFDKYKKEVKHLYEGSTRILKSLKITFLTENLFHVQVLEYENNKPIHSEYFRSKKIDTFLTFNPSIGTFNVYIDKKSDGYILTMQITDNPLGYENNRLAQTIRGSMINDILTGNKTDHPFIAAGEWERIEHGWRNKYFSICGNII